MPSTPQRGFIVRPSQESVEPEPAYIAGTPIGSMYYSNIRREDAEPEFESVNIPVGPDHYSFTNDTVEDCIKDKMLEKIKEFLENNQLNELSVLITVYQKFKELHP